MGSHHLVLLSGIRPLQTATSPKEPKQRPMDTDRVFHAVTDVLVGHQLPALSPRRQRTCLQMTKEERGPLTSHLFPLGLRGCSVSHQLLVGSAGVRWYGGARIPQVQRIRPVTATKLFSYPQPRQGRPPAPSYPQSTHGNRPAVYIPSGRDSILHFIV